MKMPIDFVRDNPVQEHVTHLLLEDGKWHAVKKGTLSVGSTYVTWDTDDDTNSSIVVSPQDIKGVKVEKP